MGKLISTSSKPFCNLCWWTKTSKNREKQNMGIKYSLLSVVVICKLKNGDNCQWTNFSSVAYLIFVVCRLGEITLGDFKEAIDRPGLYRYHFKALDPEFGTVKEEVCSCM